MELLLKSKVNVKQNNNKKSKFLNNNKNSKFFNNLKKLIIFKMA